MQQVKNYVYTDLAVKDSLTLEVEGVNEFEIAQYSSSWAANEIPTAVVMLGIGRDVRTLDFAKIHGAKLQQMQKVYVWFEPKGEYAPGLDWPVGRKKIFEGYFTGFAYRTVAGKVYVVAHLVHWLAALNFSSALTKNGHVSNPTQLNSAAVLESLGTTIGGEGNYIFLLAPAQLCSFYVQTDLWVAIKSVFCALSLIPTMPCGPQGNAGGTGVAQINSAALYALDKIEGPADGCNTPYKYGVPLEMETYGVSTVESAIALALGNEFVESYASTSFWDKLVGQFCPMFGMAVVPMVDSAIVVADVPSFNGGFWKEIFTDEYDSYDLSRELHRPLRAVGVVTGYESQTVAGLEANGEVVPVIGGMYIEDSVSPGDGMFLYVPSPAWLRSLHVQPNYSGETSGLVKTKPSQTSTTADSSTKPPEDPDTVGINVNKLYTAYAKTVYLNQMARGQTGAFSGKLRFDIAPLAILKLNATSEKFIGAGQNDLATTLYGCVQRVTVSINAEAGLAGTSFQLSHVRTELENTIERTSTSGHPLFGSSIHGDGKHGSPLVEDYEFPDAVANPFAGDGPNQPAVAA